MKLLIALHQRPHITELCFEGIKRLQKSFDIDPICVYSDSDNKAIVENYGFEGYFHFNNPLGKKLNYGLKKAFESEWDYIMQIGSDDIVTDELMNIYKPYMDKGLEGIGIREVHYYDMLTGQSAVGYSPYPFGCARIIKRDALSGRYKYRMKVLHSAAGTDFSYGKGQTIEVGKRMMEDLSKSGIAELIEKIDVTEALWTNDKNRAMDFDSHVRLCKMGVKITAIETKGVMCVDLKSEVNIWGFDFYDKVNFDVLEKIPERNAIRKVRQEYYSAVLHGE